MNQPSSKKKIYEFKLLKRRPIYLRLDMCVVGLVSFGMVAYFGKELTNMENILAIGSLILAVAFNGVLLLSNFWSVAANEFFAYAQLNNDQIEQCTNVKAIVINKKQNTTKRFIVQLLTQVMQLEPGKVHKANCVELQKKKFIYSKEKKTFTQIPFPVSETIEFYQNTEGIKTETELRKADLVWGPNKMNIPIPEFIDIYKEHMVAPFFVFQLFTSALWLLDEYWYFSLMTLVMLFMFEGTVVFQRLQNFKRLRAMRVAPYQIWIHRQNKWFQKMTDEIYPGDVILLQRNKSLKKQTVPCDLLMLSGSVVVNEAILTGESCPLVKEGIANLDKIEDVVDLVGEHKNHVLHSGTDILQFTPAEDIQADVPQLAKIPNINDGGVICVALKNGFETKQGKLMRVILFSQDRVSVESPEVYLYLLILLVFALVASYHVLTESIKDPDRSRYKIILRCILIITNVVPPELPMQLSMAVNYSIVQLIQKQIFCTEPFRIPFAGKIDICCFDKTGTLTQTDIVVQGVTGINQSDPKKIVPCENVPNTDRNTAIVLGGCHTLANTDGNIVGDPLERQAFEGMKFKQNQDGARISSGPGIQITQLKKYLFNSAIKRMSTIVQVNGSDGNSLRVLSKGAPEVLCRFMKEIPSNYKQTYLKFVKDGARVLALAWKCLPKMSQLEINAYSREQAESDLIFCGFIVAECPLKSDTKELIDELKASSHEVKMITGDNELTAAFIGQQLEFGRGPSLFVSNYSKENEIEWKDIDEQAVATTKNIQQLAQLSSKNLLCINGSMLDKITYYENSAPQIIRQIHVFSRTSPTQKGIIVGCLNSLGHKTLMCGDGTNDVGSLKRADVGLAIVNNKEPTKEEKKQKKQMSAWAPKEKLAGKSWQEQQKIQMEHMQEYQKQMAAMAGDQAQLELGDACIAAPFTYKFASLKSVKKVIRQGRSTLTTTFQMYKILSLNSLISAYTMSALYLDGVKMGDYQATTLGLGISVLFMMLSFSKPLKKLHKERPPTSIFHWSLTISVSVQFVTHLSVLIYFVNLCEPYLDRTDASLGYEAEFKPNLKNSVMFIYQWWLQTTVIFVNYSGRPFMQSISENKKIQRMLFFMFGMASLIIFDFSAEIRDMLELVPFPNFDFQKTIITCLAVDLMICYGIEMICRYFYLKQFK